MKKQKTINLIDECRTAFQQAELDDHARKKYLGLCDTLQDLDCQAAAEIEIPAGETLNLRETIRERLNNLPPNEYGARRIRAVQVIEAILGVLETL